MAKKRKTELDIDGPSAPAAETAAKEEAAPQAAPAEAAAEGEKPKEKKERKPLNIKFILISVLSFIVLMGVGVAAVFMSSGKKKETAHKEPPKKAAPEKEKAKKKEPPPPAFVKFHNIVLGPFLLPHKGKEGKDALARVVFALQVNDPEVIDEIHGNLPLIRNGIWFVLSSRDPRELGDEEKRRQLLKDLQYNIDRSLQSGRVEAVMLNELEFY